MIKFKIFFNDYYFFLVIGQDKFVLWAWCRIEEVFGSIVCRGFVVFECRLIQMELVRC